MVSGVKKSSSLPILFDKELNNFDTNKSTNNRYNNKKEDNCKYNSLMRNNNTLKINSKLFFNNNDNNNNNNNNNEQKEKKNCTTKKLKISESGLDSFRFLTTPRRTNIINHSSTLSINDQLQQISLTDSLKKKINNVLREPVRVIKITEIIEIKDSEYKDNNNNNNNTRTKQIEMSPHSTTSTVDSNESNDDSDNNNNKNTQHESNLNKTFVKSPPISRKIESRSKQHQIHSTTHVKSSDYFNFNHFNKQDTEKKRNENINNDILMEIFKLTNKSLHQLETNKYNQQQLSGTNTFNSLNRQQSKVQEFKSNQSENEDGIPVVHNFSFIDKNANLPQNDSNNKPKRILIKITGRTRSSSNDPKNLINKVNLNLGKYQLDQVYSQQNQNNYNKQPIQLKIHRLEKNPEHSIQNNNNESNTFSVDKFKSYLNNLKETDVNNNNRSLSTPPPSERNILNEKLINNQINNLKSTPNRSSPARKIEQMPNGDWIETFKPEPDFSSDLGSVNKPFQSNHHMSLIKNAGDIIYNKTSAFNTVNISNNNDQNESFVPVWTFRENNKNADTDASKLIKDKANNLGSFSCGLISPRPKNLNLVLDENLTINDEYDYSPTFYPSENHLADEIHTSNKNKIVKNSSNQNKFVKKVSSYYNDYYRDLFLNQSINNSNKNSEFTHNNNLEISTKYEASKYIDDEEDTSTDTNLESYNENHSVFEKFKNNLYESTTLPMNNLITKRSNLTTNHESMNNNEIAPRTPKLSRRVIFADECYK
jgi:hypothetical protein